TRRARGQTHHGARQSLALGKLRPRWRHVVFLAAGVRAGRGAGLPRRSRGRPPRTYEPRPALLDARPGAVRWPDRGAAGLAQGPRRDAVAVRRLETGHVRTFSV